LCSEFSVTCKIELGLPEYQFSKKITTYFANKALFASNVRLMMYKMQPDGTYALADPPHVEFEVVEVYQASAT
jgi:hypothetical protein